MNKTTLRSVLYKGHRFPPTIISHCVWVYFRFCLSFRDVSELLFFPKIASHIVGLHLVRHSRSRCQSFVVMMQATDFRKRDHPTSVRQMYGPRTRRVQG